MLYFEPKGRGTNLAGALDYMNRVISRRAVVFIDLGFHGSGFQQGVDRDKSAS
jgi:hypothetical protein